jgi:hypothetical protein
MSGYNIFPFAVVNRFVLDQLNTNNIMTPTVIANGNTLSSITPGGEIPEFNNADLQGKSEAARAFIVYTVAMSLGKDVMIDEETLTYTVVGTSVSKVMEITYFIRELTRRFDWSAQHINNWTRTHDATTAFHFLEMRSEMIVGPQPVRQEGGRYATMLSIKYSYVENNNGNPSSDTKGMKN